MEKYVFHVTEPEDNQAWCMDYLWTGMEGGIEDGINYRHLMWQDHDQENKWGVPIIYVRNVFNEENQTSMLLIVWYEWTSDAQYNFNFYFHQYILVIWDEGGMNQFLQSKNGWTKDTRGHNHIWNCKTHFDKRDLWVTHLDVSQPWYTNYLGAECSFSNIKNIEYLMSMSLAHG